MNDNPPSPSNHLAPAAAPDAPPLAEPIQPPYRTRGGVPVCEDCGRVRCICAYRNEDPSK